MTISKQNILNRIVQNKVIHHTLFWILSYYVLLTIFSNTSRIVKIDYIYTLIFLSTLAIAVYINFLILIPKLLNTKRYLLYLALVVATLILGSLFNMLMFSRLIDYILPGYYFISYYSFFNVLKFFFVIVASTTLLKLSKEWFQLAETKHKLAEIEKEKIEIELKALRSQINPHFLFNSLNVIYSLALKKATETTETITTLSDILRYVIYDSNVDEVKISSEVQLIKNYLNIQNHRIDESTKVIFNVDLQNDAKIPPLLFLPLVENSFKHGIKGDISNTFVYIDLIVNDQNVLFEIENNKGCASKIEKKEGIGLENIKQRLALLMPNKHSFNIIENEHRFKVILKLTV